MTLPYLESLPDLGRARPAAVPSLFPELTPETPALDIALEPQAPARATYRCAGPCRGSYVFDAPGTWCYWCKRNGHDESGTGLAHPFTPDERREAQSA